MSDMDDRMRMLGTLSIDEQVRRKSTSKEIGDGVALRSRAHPESTEALEDADFSNDSLETIEFDDGKDE